MSALSTPGGGGTTAQTKPTSGKQKYQKLDINSLYCTNRNENSEPSLVKSQLSRKHGMQSLGKVPSARRPPANLPSLKTETGQDPNANSISAVTTSVSTPATCTSQTVPTTSISSVAASTCPSGWVSLPPPSSPHFRTEFPSLEAAAQPSHRSSDHATSQPQLRPQTEGSWTCGGGTSVRSEVASPAPATQQTPAFRAILPSFLVKGSGGGGLGLGALGSLPRGATPVPGARAPRVAASASASAAPRAQDILSARPILRPDQISSLDDISRDAGWAQHDDIDYDQKLDFSDGESSAPSKASKNNNRASIESERVDTKIQELTDEEQIWAERRQKQNNEMAQVIARARQRKEEEQRRQMRDTAPLQPKDSRDRIDRDRNDNRDREPDNREKERLDNRERTDNRERDRFDNREKERNDHRDGREKDRNVDNRDRIESRDRFDNRERDRDVRDRERERDRGRNDNRDRQDSDKDRMDMRDRDRNERDRGDRMDRERFDRGSDRADRDRMDRDRDRDRNDRDRDFRDRDRDYGRDRDQPNSAFSKTFQNNMPPRFLKQQQNRQQDDQHKGWAFSGKTAPRRQEPPQYNAPRHNGRRSYSRDFSDREDDFRRDKDGPGPQWRSEMQDYDRTGRELDRSNSKDSYKEYSDYKDRRSESDRKSIDNSSGIEHSSRTAADKLTEVFERKSIGITDSFTASDSATPVQTAERRTPPSAAVQRESSERDFGKTSWAEITQDETSTYSKTPTEKLAPAKETEQLSKDIVEDKSNFNQQSLSTSTQQTISNHPPSGKNFVQNQQVPQIHPYPNIQSQPSVPIHQSQTISDTNQTISKPLSKPSNLDSNNPQAQLQTSSDLTAQNLSKPVFSSQKSEKDLSESESIASKSSTDPSGLVPVKMNEAHSAESLQTGGDAQKRSVDDKRGERFNNEQLNKISLKEPVERKSSGSGSEKKGRGYGGGGGGAGGAGGAGGFAVYSRGWGRDARGRRSQRSSRSNNRASESDGSTDGAPNAERKERRRAPRSPRGPKGSAVDHVPQPADNVENREPFAPRGQPSRRGRGGFQGASRPPAPAKRVTGYGPPNTKSPFSQANRAVKDDDVKDAQGEDKNKSHSKPRTGSSTGRGRERRPKGAGGPFSGEDENWETTSEHSEGGTNARRGRAGAQQKGPRGQNNRQNSGRHPQGTKKDMPADNKTTEVIEAMIDLKISGKKDDEVVDDGFQEVRNKKNSKDTRGSATKDETVKQPRSHSNQGGGRNGSSTRNSNDKSNSRGSAQVVNKPTSQYERPRQANLAPRFVKQRQKQQMGLVTGFGPDTGAAPPPPPVNAWDKPISQTLRGNVEEPVENVENKSNQSSQRSTPGETQNVVEIKPVQPTCIVPTDKTGVLDGATPPVETIIFENTNYKTAPPAEALKQKYQPSANTAKPQGEEIPTELDTRQVAFNGEVRSRPRSIQELMADTNRPGSDAEGTLGLPITFDTSQKAEDSSDMKLDFTFDTESLGQLTEDKTAKSLGLPRGVHMSTSSTISPLAADLNLKIASVKKVWEMPAVVEGSEELQFPGFEETNTETGAPPNVCKVKPTQQLQSPPPQHYNHVGYQGGYGGLSVPSPPAVLFNSSQQLLGSSQQLPQQGGLYGAFLDQSRGQFGTFPGTPYGAGSAGPYNYHQQPPPDGMATMFQSLPNQYRMAAAGGGAAFGQSGQLGNNPSTVLISSTSNSLMSATVKPSSQQIGAIGSKGGGVGGVGGVGSVSTYQQQYLGYSGPVGEAPYSLPGLLPRPAPPASSYYSPYQPPTAPAPTYPLQFTQPAQSGAFGSQFISSQLQVAAAVQQMQQQYRAPMQQQYAAPPQPRPPPQQMKSPLHEHANGFAPLCESASPTPKGSKPQKPPHSPPQHKYHAPPPLVPPAITPLQHHPPHQQQYFRP
ncbi:protein PRRC2C isoform X2 [Plodia interpunctella]|uniref:protein PRRC2C isoform X2 n=1 Tax=Plodia interpunctella TaxID=58824 RepID=UPI002367555A|nr:protein PRRC2C isoform X2 [Plodia interpunctella]